MVKLQLYVGDLDQDEYDDIKRGLDEELNNGEEDYELLTEKPDNAPLTGDLPYLAVINDTLEKPHSVHDRESVEEIINNLKRSEIESQESGSSERAL